MSLKDMLVMFPKNMLVELLAVVDADSKTLLSNPIAAVSNNDFQYSSHHVQLRMKMILGVCDLPLLAITAQLSKNGRATFLFIYISRLIE